jgi:CrcB protein
MTPLIFLLASVAGGIGACLRYAADLAIMSLSKNRFPWGIVIVNVTGSFALGLVTAALPDAAFVVGAGLIGGYTTFSTAMLDTVALWKAGARRASVLQLVGTFAVSVIAALVGLAIGATL